MPAPARLRRAVRATLGTLTLRGRCLLAAGAATGLAGLVLAERDLVRVAVLLVALPLLARAVAARTRFRLTCGRRLEPARIATGSQSRVVLRLENVSRLPTGLMLVEDAVPYLLGGRPRLVLDRLAPHRPVDIGYPVTGAARGRYVVGPLTVRLMDPFGLCEVPRAFATTETLVVTPQVVPLPAVRLTGEWAGSGQSTARSVATSGEDDAATREYRRGDDLRRVHWRSTARRGELTVRREEQPWQSRAALLLDTRLVAHRGDGPTSSFEWAVAAAASIGVHLSRSGFGLRLMTESGQPLGGHADVDAAVDSSLLDVLAVVGPSTTAGVGGGASTLRRGGGEGLQVAVLGALSGSDGEELARTSGGSATVKVALLLDVASWTTSSPRGAQLAAADHERSRQRLLTAGWRVVEASRGDSLADLWAAAGRTVAATASRSVVAPTVTGAA